MAREADLKKIELKVSVNCCDGCKKKVKKLLQRTEGVLKIEIDPVQPKVTVLGSVEPQILIRKLLRVGKQAQLLSRSIQNAFMERKDVDIFQKKETEKPKYESENWQPKTPETFDGNNTTDKGIKERRDGGDGSGDKATKKDQKPKVNDADAFMTEVVKKDNPLPSVPEINPSRVYGGGNTNTVTTQNQQCYKVEPCSISIPYYLIPSYAPPPPPPCYGSDYYNYNYDYGRPIYQPPFQAASTRVGDYFSDENTVGCSIM